VQYALIGRGEGRGREEGTTYQGHKDGENEGAQHFRARVCSVVVVCVEGKRRVGMSMRVVSKKDKLGQRGRVWPMLEQSPSTHAHDLNRKTSDNVEWCVPCARAAEKKGERDDEKECGRDKDKERRRGAKGGHALPCR